MHIFFSLTLTNKVATLGSSTAISEQPDQMTTHTGEDQEEHWEVATGHPQTLPRAPPPLMSFVFEFILPLLFNPILGRIFMLPANVANKSVAINQGCLEWDCFYRCTLQKIILIFTNPILRIYRGTYSIAYILLLYTLARCGVQETKTYFQSPSFCHPTHIP